MAMYFFFLFRLVADYSSGNTLVPVIKQMGESQGFSAGRFVIRRCDIEPERICCPHCEMPCMGHLCGGTEGELSASLCPRWAPRAQSGGTVCVVSAVGFVCLREWVCISESVA